MSTTPNTPPLKVRPIPGLAPLALRPSPQSPPKEPRETEGLKPILGNLTRKQKLFVYYYLTGLSAVKAAEKAGYSKTMAQNAAWFLLDNPNVLAEINKVIKRKYEQLELDTEKIIGETATIAFSNILDFIEVDENTGSFKVDLRKVTRHNAAAIQELTLDAEGRPRIRLADKRSALELLARYNKFAMLAENKQREAGGTGEQQPLTINKLDLIIQNVQNQLNVAPGQQGRLTLPAPVVE